MSAAMGYKNIYEFGGINTWIDEIFRNAINQMVDKSCDEEEEH